MKILTICIASFLSLFSTCVMSYISMATPIGPWIAPTLVLLSMLLFKLVSLKEHENEAISLTVIAGSIGGILATACGFSFPTLYFLDPTLFNQWLADPLYFCAVMSGLSLGAGFFGLIVAHVFEYRLLVKDKLAFPIGQLVYKMISAGDQIRKAYELAAGFVLTAFFCLLQDGIAQWNGIIPRALTVVPALSWRALSIPMVRFDLWPMLWAIGFVTGHVIALPLAVGALTKVFLVDVSHTLWFSHLSALEFSMTFCSGMVLFGLIQSFIPLPKMIMQALDWTKKQRTAVSFSDAEAHYGYTFAAGAGLLLLSGLYLRHFNFSLPAILFLFVGSFGCVYQIMYIAGKIGLAPLGRFATFVMIPALLLFGLDMVQTVFVATFVEICGGVAADVLFGRKIAQLMKIDERRVFFSQILGLIVSSLCVGVVFYLLISFFHLGSAELFAYKSQSRALQIAVKQFDYYGLLIGGLFSFVLSRLRVNPMLVLGGILMPMNISFGLIFGGILTLFAKNREEWEPFWSGVFASNSIWMLLQAVLGR